MTKMFGPSAIRVKQDNLNGAQTFIMPNGVEVRVPDAVAANEKFEHTPPTVNACYSWLSSVVIRSRLGYSR